MFSWLFRVIFFLFLFRFVFFFSPFFSKELIGNPCCGVHRLRAPAVFNGVCAVSTLVFSLAWVHQVVTRGGARRLTRREKWIQQNLALRKGCSEHHGDDWELSLEHHCRMREFATQGNFFPHLLWCGQELWGCDMFKWKIWRCLVWNDVGGHRNSPSFLALFSLSQIASQRGRSATAYTA